MEGEGKIIVNISLPHHLTVSCFSHLNSRLQAIIIDLLKLCFSTFDRWIKSI